ncbi:DUF2232 domain-containing protein [Bradyrhizobium jicamae]|uniref:DUF2232 domain-containing protein n=1 Tax=Bradyrhizobium jicamae TaxID=280332 RepID=A0ABS5FJT1_9BRAD|nr:DUF2232 domain-containing protein [Bradyrhizobium jicamae]MBR0796651.1 DUF2232 domain-containing protein [Bradyrhizobium jicamae]
MIAIFIVAIAAGAASGLMFASVISGELISLLLFYLAPLPLMVTALGWGPLAAAIGGIAAAACLGAIFGLPYCIAFAVIVALPGWWLGHLALLGRPIESATDGAESAPPQFEWYPVGRIVLWIAAFALITTTAALLTLGSDAETIHVAMRRGLLRIISAAADGQTGGDIERFVDVMVAMAPIAGSMVAMVTLTLNLWLAGKVTQTSGRLNRPWPDLRATALPPMTLVALLVALGLSFVGGLLAILAQVVSTALMIAFAIIGFAVLHTVTLSLNSRGFWLFCTYAIVVVFAWPLAALIALGIADALFGLRQRYLRSRPPPLPAS